MESEASPEEGGEASLNKYEWRTVDNALYIQQKESAHEFKELYDQFEKEHKEVTSDSTAEEIQEESQQFDSATEALTSMLRGRALRRKLERDVPDFNTSANSEKDSPEEYKVSLTLVEAAHINQALLDAEARGKEKLRDEKNSEDIYFAKDDIRQNADAREKFKVSFPDLR